MLWISSRELTLASDLFTPLSYTLVLRLEKMDLSPQSKSLDTCRGGFRQPLYCIVSEGVLGETKRWHVLPWLRRYVPQAGSQITLAICRK